MKKMNEPIAYCVGTDVSKDKLDVCVVAQYQDRTIKVKATKKFGNTPEGRAEMYGWSQKHCKTPMGTEVQYVMEATGVYHEELAWYLYRQDVQVVVEMAKKIRYFGISMNAKSKTDKADAQIIARYGLGKKLHQWKPISKTIYEVRLLTRQRTTLQAQKTQLLNQMHALRHSGYETGWMQQQLLPIIQALDEQVGEFEKQVYTVVQADDVLKKKIDILCSIKGLGFLSAAAIVAETNGFAAIQNQKQLASYAGYDVAERQSGQYRGKTKISKQGNARIRAALHFPALNVVKYTETFKNVQQRIYGRTGLKMKGYVAVQRKLLCLIYTLWKTDTGFEDGFLQDKAPKTIVEKHNASLHEMVSKETSLLSNAKV